MLNATGRFAAAAAAPVLLNIILVGVLLATAWSVPDGKMTNLSDPAERFGLALAWATKVIPAKPLTMRLEPFTVACITELT